MPISCLPEETLLNIFSLCSRDGLEDREYLFSECTVWDWICITHVCRHWRNLAMSSPYLWHMPSLARHSPDRLETFLDRSQNAPLTIYDSYKRCSTRSTSRPGKCKRCRDNIIVVLQHLHHIRRLNIFHVDVLIMNALLNKSAPRLEELDIVRHASEIEDLPVLLPHNLLAYAPSLKALRLRGFYLPFSSHLLQGLDSLLIYDNDWDHFSMNSSLLHPTVDEFLKFLRLSPTIRELTLLTVRDSAREDVDHENFEKLKIAIPTLKYFEIKEMDISTCENLVQHIDFPALADINIGLRYVDVSNFPRILSILTQITKYRVCNFLVLLLIVNEVSVEAKPSFESSEVGTGEMSLSLYKTRGNGIPLEIEMDFGGIAVMMGNMISGSYWKNATSVTLEVDTEYALDVHRWEMLLKSFEHLEELCLRTEELISTDPEYSEEIILLENNIISALFMHSNDAADEVVSEESRSSVILPRLTGLDLFVSSIEHISGRLLQCVKARKEHGLPIHDLFVDIVDSPSYDFEEWNAGWCTEVRKFVSRFGHAEDLE